MSEDGNDDVREGGCACGAIRYRIEGPITDAGYCHCRLCQRTTGAPVVAWAALDADAFHRTGMAPGAYASSAHGTRLFCRSCGTQIGYRDARAPDLMNINLATLDDPAAVPPQVHLWTDSRIPWFETIDDLPRHAGDFEP